MNTLKFTLKFLSVTFLTFALGMVNINTKNEQYFTQANASITGEGYDDLVRFLYMLINGPTSNGYPSDYDSGGAVTSVLPSGFLGMIRTITGTSALGGGLIEAGYSTCASIPADDSNYTMTEEDGSQFKMYFETPLKTIPTGYTGAGGTFDKRVVVRYRSSGGGTYATFFNIEFQCDTNVGWLRFFDNNAASSTVARHIEVFWDTQSSTAAKMEMYMVYEPGGGSASEYMLIKFATDTGNIFKFWIVRAEDDTSDTVMRAIAEGNSSTFLVNTYLYLNTDISNTSTSLTEGAGDVTGTGNLQCLDMTDVASVTDSGDATCITASLVLDSPGTPLIDGGSAAFTIAWVAEQGTTGMEDDMTNIAEPAVP